MNMKVEPPGSTYFSFSHEHAEARGHRLPGNGTVIVFTHSYVDFAKRGEGYGLLAHKERLAWAREHGFTAALCTVNSNNIPQIRILEKCGWTRCGMVIPCDECSTEAYLWMKDLSRLDEEVSPA